MSVGRLSKDVVFPYKSFCLDRLFQVPFLIPQLDDKVPCHLSDSVELKYSTAHLSEGC